MEAIGSGLPIIGFDVPYGNQTFVTEGKNGYLIPPSADQVVDQIASACFLHRSYLMHLFRDETGYTIGKYITEKRLYLANHAIEQGVSVTDACYQSGFRNYTTFYQAYRNKYHKSPKQARK